MKKKYVILIVLGVILVLGLYIGYKSYYYFKYMPDIIETKKMYIDQLKINETITIKTKNLDNYFKVNDINIRNDFSDFDLFNYDEYESGYVSKENENILISFGTSRFNYLEVVKNLDNDDWIKDIFKEKNIQNDFDLMKYIINNNDEKLNIFSSKHEIEFYSAIYTSVMTYSIFEEITFIQGDLSGFILKSKSKDTIKVYLFDSLNKYVITFKNSDYFTDDYIEELLSTVAINKNVYEDANLLKEECLESLVGGFISSNITPLEVELNSIIDFDASLVNYSKVKISDTGSIYIIVKTSDENIINTLNNYFTLKYNGYQYTRLDDYNIYVYNGFDDLNLETEVKICN